MCEIYTLATVLNGDMREALPAYLGTRVRNPDSVPVSDVATVVAFNLRDTLTRAPYGQARLQGILNDSTPEADFLRIREAMMAGGRAFFEAPWAALGLDAVLSVNNRHAGHAAAARYPALCVPMGYRESGEPAGLTLIGKPLREKELLNLAAAYEALSAARRYPAGYRN